MAELKPEDWEELDEVINRQKQLYTEEDLETARAEERERCAMVCDDIAMSAWKDYKMGPHHGEPYYEGYSDGAESGALAIRKMGEK